MRYQAYFVSRYGYGTSLHMQGADRSLGSVLVIIILLVVICGMFEFKQFFNTFYHMHGIIRARV